MVPFELELQPKVVVVSCGATVGNPALQLSNSRCSPPPPPPLTPPLPFA